MKKPLSIALLLFAGCSAGDGPGGTSEPGDRLSDLGLFLDGPSQTPAPGVVPYEVVAPLFSDETVKHRFVKLPDGGKIRYQSDARWRFPTGTILVKTFGYLHDYRDPSRGERLLETRLLRREEDRWTVDVYVWNEEQTDAFRKVAGQKVPVSWIDAHGATRELVYRVPNANQCLGCHGEPGVTDVLGPRTRQLNRDHDYGNGPENQLDHFERLGMFDAPLPPSEQRPALVDPFGDAPLEARARSYLEANCAHCHNPEGAAKATGLYLGIEVTDPLALGFCRSPFSAGDGTGGRQFDVVPGNPDASILVYRMASTDPEIKMPEMPTQLADERGVALIREWIASLPPDDCR